MGAFLGARVRTRPLAIRVFPRPDSAGAASVYRPVGPPARTGGGSTVQSSTVEHGAPRPPVRPERRREGDVRGNRMDILGGAEGVSRGRRSTASLSRTRPRRARGKIALC
ncbi:hypothetical protein Srubr_81000 [Streptomyces rubradiris]|uniref:Uncharacterized protein n=1 Tax=Streptomyces rubradiris TaxID=285531 RepID=A0ABQ3RQY8_STRRR|nr:hypothetical protein GCM10018792_62650 [Streptomyces rubradiris]GHI58254.1 hypothetical protein Srubr_81000 [Streptomyces rubradiris]